MPSHKNLGRFMARSLLGSFLLTLTVLLAQQASVGHGRALPSMNKRNEIRAVVAVAAAAEGRRSLWKPQVGYEHLLPHSPYTNQQASSSGALQTNSAGRRRQSLFSHVNDDRTQSEEVPTQEQLQKQGDQQQQPMLGNQYHHPEGRDHSRLTFHQQENVEQRDTNEDLDFWGEDEARALIEPHYPSIDLFEEDDDSASDSYSDHNRRHVSSTVEDDEDEQLLELGDDGVFRQQSRHLSLANSQADHPQHVWMVDEWEEDLEGEMDELLDWAEEDEHHLLERIERQQRALGSKHLRDQEDSSLENGALDEEDEASPFERIFSESWLF